MADGIPDWLQDTSNELRFVTDLLGILADAEKTFEDTPMIWHVKDGHAKFAMVCSDTFAWGCADAEPITAEDLPLLRQCLADLRTADAFGEIWLGELYCCRKRGMRPMNRWIKDMREKNGLPDSVLALIEQCGPSRESVFGAP